MPTQFNKISENLFEYKQIQVKKATYKYKNLENDTAVTAEECAKISFSHSRKTSLIHCGK